MKLSSPFLNRGARLELLSLMDVMFLVLVFFVYAIFDMSVHKGLKVDLPSAAGNHERGERIVITIDAENMLQLDGRAMDQKQLILSTSEAMKKDPERSVLISGDRRASLGVGIELLSKLQAIGIEKTSFQVNGAKDVDE